MLCCFRSLRLFVEYVRDSKSIEVYYMVCSYLDNISISGVLDINNIQSGILNLTKNSASTSRTLEVLSLMNNSIADVLFDKQFLLDGQIKFL